MYNHKMTEAELISELAFHFARTHKFLDFKETVHEIGCRMGPNMSELTQGSWIRELNKCIASISESIQDTLDNHEMMLLYGEFAEDSIKEETDDESWVQLAQGSW